MLVHEQNVQPPAPRLGPPGTRRLHQQSASVTAGRPAVGSELEKIAVAAGVEFPPDELAVDMRPYFDGNRRTRANAGVDDVIPVPPKDSAA